MCKVLCIVAKKSRTCLFLFEKISRVRVRVDFQKYSFEKDLQGKGENKFSEIIFLNRSQG